MNDGIGDARKFILDGNLRDAAKLLDRIIGKNKEDDYAWYLRGLVSLKLNNHDYAHECFEHAMANKKKAEYFKGDGIAHMEMLELKPAINSFERAAQVDVRDAENYFYIAACYILLDNPTSKEYMQKAYLRDKKKTKEMLIEFYKHVYRNGQNVGKKTHEKIVEKIESI